jgi:hypothetical protein
MNVGNQIAELEQAEAAEIARQNEQRRADLASKYARLLAKESPTGDDVAAIFELAKGLGRSAAEVEVDRKAVVAFNRHHEELLPGLEQAQRESQKARDAVNRARKKLGEAEAVESRAASQASALNVPVRQLPGKCRESCLFTVSGRDVTPRFELETPKAEESHS